jgi:two-component system, LytTR family, response regulator
VREVSAVVADDEPIARRRLRELAAEVPWLECIGEAADGDEAVRAVDELKPDLLFLDIEMPGLTGLQVLDQIRHRPAVIFTTAYDRYAVTAFELRALDYLLKPFGPDRFKEAVDRARQAVRLKGDEATDERLREALAAQGPLTRIFVRSRGRVVPVAVSEIHRIEAQDDYVAVHTSAHHYLVHTPLGEIERRLDPARFLRVHRSHIVNLDHVTGLSSREGARFEVEMRDGSRVIASRTGSRELRRRASLGDTHGDERR